MDKQFNFMFGDIMENTDVTISKDRYEELLEAESFLSALEQAGVDNWEGYDLAEDIYEAFNK